MGLREILKEIDEELEVRRRQLGVLLQANGGKDSVNLETGYIYIRWMP